jgi:SAM-dependent methyltransferase
MSDLKLDLGCGSRKSPGFLGVDRRKFGEVDAVTDLSGKLWEFEPGSIPGIELKRLDSGAYVLPDSCVAEVYCSHFLEHLDHNQRNPERVRFMNELHRVMVPDGKATIITPHWASNRAYGDFTHADKPVSEMFYAYLSKEWRASNAPDNDIQWHPDGYSCDFTATLSYSMHPRITDGEPPWRSSAARALRAFLGRKVQDRDEYRSYAIAFYKEAAQDLVATLFAQK